MASWQRARHKLDLMKASLQNLRPLFFVSLFMKHFCLQQHSSILYVSMQWEISSFPVSRLAPCFNLPEVIKTQAIPEITATSNSYSLSTWMSLHTAGDKALFLGYFLDLGTLDNHGSKAVWSDRHPLPLTNHWRSSREESRAWKQ